MINTDKQNLSQQNEKEIYNNKKCFEVFLLRILFSIFVWLFREGNKGCLGSCRRLNKYHDIYTSILNISLTEIEYYSMSNI